MFSSLLTILEFSNEVQNFLYLSREFDTSHVGEGMDEPSLACKLTSDP